MKKIDFPKEIDIMKMSLFNKMLSDSTRLKILFSIKTQEKSVNDIVALVGETQSAVSHQLSLLRDVNMVKTKRDGNKIYYSLADSTVAKILDIVYLRIK